MRRPAIQAPALKGRPFVIKPSIFVLAAAIVAAPAFAQAAAPAALPMCSAKVKDSCQQGPRQEAAAMTAAQAEASGGVGDRKSDQSAKMGDGMAVKHKMMKKHHAKKATMMAPAADAAAATPK
jgi:hypothetical protein